MPKSQPVSVTDTNRNAFENTKKNPLKANLKENKVQTQKDSTVHKSLSSTNTRYFHIERVKREIHDNTKDSALTEMSKETEKVVEREIHDNTKDSALTKVSEETEKVVKEQKKRKSKSERKERAKRIKIEMEEREKEITKDRHSSLLDPLLNANIATLDSQSVSNTIPLSKSAKKKKPVKKETTVTEKQKQVFNCCGRLFTEKSSLNNHKRKHIRCPLCPFLGIKRTLEDHHQEFHRDKKSEIKRIQPVKDALPKVPTTETVEEILEWINRRKQLYPKESVEPTDKRAYPPSSSSIRPIKDGLPKASTAEAEKKKKKEILEWINRRKQLYPREDVKPTDKSTCHHSLSQLIHVSSKYREDLSDISDISDDEFFDAASTVSEILSMYPL
ncbi:hypothetical protein BDF14DRAFT_1834178 [Spinellus fusiger]|nr:hypothetical protein BDF14DRAFT_1834178 [Spinellus fusiger]